jgi:hypothetical protein
MADLYTQGIWGYIGTREKGFDICLVDEQGEYLEEITCEENSIDYEPNAQLMAAAPDLLQAIEQYFEVLTTSDLLEVEGVMKAAIKKAREGTPVKDCES